jgi:F0F1-type ATP synthase membrane subunit c/vacuolar-type H+-ATPase subunit K
MTMAKEQEDVSVPLAIVVAALVGIAALGIGFCIGVAIAHFLQ